MKIIHTADIHLGSKLDSKFSKEISNIRKSEQRITFINLVNYASNNNVKAIILAGDIFDNDKPLKKDKDFFYSVIKENPNIDFLYLKGNHDITDQFEIDLPNLKTFSDKWEKFTYDNIVISGIELTNDNNKSLYSTLLLNKDNLNIVVMHGQVGFGVNDINISKLREKNIDYLALGHIHSYSQNKIDNRGIYVYSGCLEGRGFDEMGDKGFVELDILNNKIEHKFISFAKRKIIEENIDISNLDNAYMVAKKIKNEISFNNNDIYRINLCGEVGYDVEELEEDVFQYLKNSCFFINIKDKTTRKIDIHKFDYDLSLRGEFVRTVNSNDDYNEEEKLKIITLGLKALDGNGVE